MMVIQGKELELSLHASFINVFLLLTATSFLRLITIRPGFLPKPTISVDFSGRKRVCETINKINPSECYCVFNCMNMNVVYVIIYRLGSKELQKVLQHGVTMVQLLINVTFISDLTKDLNTKSSWIVCKSCSIFTSPTARHCKTCNG